MWCVADAELLQQQLQVKPIQSMWTRVYQLAKLKPTCLLGSNCKPQQRLLFLQEIWTWTIIFLETKTKFQESSLVPSVFVSRALFGFFAREAAKNTGVVQGEQHQ